MFCPEIVVHNPEGAKVIKIENGECKIEKQINFLSNLFNSPF